MIGLGIRRAARRQQDGSGSHVPAQAILDMNGQPILDLNGQFILDMTASPTAP